MVVNSPHGDGYQQVGTAKVDAAVNILAITSTNALALTVGAL